MLWLTYLIIICLIQTHCLHENPLDRYTEYKWIELGDVDFSRGGYVWFAHSHNKAVSDVYVDRLLFVRVP